jgi:hypothetical protein
VWDVTRQNESVGWKVVDGVTTEVEVEGIVPNSWPTKVEEPNDDGGPDDEDNVPNADKIYSFDGPGLKSDISFAERYIVRFNFREFVRVKIGEEFTNVNGLVEGSRCSDEIEWCSRMDITDDGAGKWQRNGADNKIVLGNQALGGPP